VHHSIRGRGLFLITTQLVDTLDFEDHENWGLIVRFKKKIYLDNQNNLCHKDQL
jgi:anti-sigma regulatory factor (Ser/Thr protein kinase)